MEDSVAEGGLNCEVLAQEVSEKMNVIMWPRGHSCDLLAKNVAAFCPCPKRLPEARLKSFRLTELAEEISKYPSINSCVY